MTNLDALNSVTISVNDLMDINKRMVDFHIANGPDSEVIFHLIAQEYKDDINKGLAISLRLYALAKLVREGIPAWTLPEQPDGAIPVRECVFAAAAVEPLIEISEQVVFGKESFLRKSLEYSELEGEA